MPRKWTASELKNNLGGALRQAEKAPVVINRAPGGGGKAQTYILMTDAQFRAIKGFAQAAAARIMTSR